MDPHDDGGTGLKFALVLILGLFSGLLGFSAYLVLDRVAANEKAIAGGILPLATERFRSVERRIDRLEDAIEKQQREKHAP